MDRSVAFFRNLNLGHRRSPVRPQLIEAFLSSGATDAVSFQTNGTVVFTAEDPRATARAARDALAVVGYTDPVMVCTLTTVTTVAAFPDDPGFAECCVSFFDPLEPVPDIPRTSTNGLAEILLVGKDHAVSGVRRVEGRMGDPNGHLEKSLGAPVTTRTLGTIRRLAAKFADSATG